jgi:hypothetical protein
MTDEESGKDFDVDVKDIRVDYTIRTDVPAPG